MRTKQWLLLFAFGLCACNTGNGIREDLPEIEKLQADSIFIDASYTSLSGQWIMKDSLLLSLDKYIVGIKVFDRNGHYVKQHIRQGRGPNEMIQPAWITALDNVSGNLVIMDNSGMLLQMDDNFEIVSNTKYPWFTMLSESFGIEDVEYLMYNPDPEAKEMYEYNFECDRMLSDNGQLYIPVTTEHIKFNKYMKGKVSRNFWKNAHTFISLDIDSVSTSGFMFGKYPAIYRKRHIPAFSDYDFAIAENRIYVTFEADPLIYVMDLQGNGIGSFGVADKNIAASYPTSHSFEDYEMNSGKLKSEYGYYDRIYADGRYIMRTCRRDDGTWVMQVYNPANELVALYDVGSRIEIIGQYDGLYYAVCGVDMENEKFMLIRFKL